MKTMRKMNKVKAVEFVSEVYAPHPPLHFLKVSRGGMNAGRYKLTGDLRILYIEFLRGYTPFGIVLDRMQECPHELVAANLCCWDGDIDGALEVLRAQ